MNHLILTFAFRFHILLNLPIFPTFVAHIPKVNGSVLNALCSFLRFTEFSDMKVLFWTHSQCQFLNGKVENLSHLCCPQQLCKYSWKLASGRGRLWTAFRVCFGMLSENHEPWISDAPLWLQLLYAYLMQLSGFGQRLVPDGHISSLALASFLDFPYSSILKLVTKRSVTNSLLPWMFGVRKVYSIVR